MNKVRSPVEDQREAFLLLKNAADQLGAAIMKLNENQQVMLTAIGQMKQDIYQLDKRTAHIGEE